jgi:hypothetical protein
MRGAKVRADYSWPRLVGAPECACSAQRHGSAVLRSALRAHKGPDWSGLRNAPAAHTGNGCTLCGAQTQHE